MTSISEHALNVVSTYIDIKKQEAQRRLDSAQGKFRKLKYMTVLDVYREFQIVLRTSKTLNEFLEGIEEEEDRFLTEVSAPTEALFEGDKDRTLLKAQQTIIFIREKRIALNDIKKNLEV